MNIRQKTADKGVPGSKNVLGFQHGNILHTGGVRGSTPFAPTSLSATFPTVKEVPSGSNEPMEGRKLRSTKRTPNCRVYFIQCQCAVGYIKIGVANDPFRRMAEMQVSSPYPLKLIHDVPGGEAEELAMHFRFFDLHHRGEWFLPGDELLRFCGLETKKSLQRKRRQPKQGNLPFTYTCEPWPEDEIYRGLFVSSRSPSLGVAG